jgi:hypothetical protein
MMCRALGYGDGCKYGDKCTFAHSVQELSKAGVGYKLHMCRYIVAGKVGRIPCMGAPALLG